MGSLSYDLTHGIGRIGDYWLGDDGKVYYNYQNRGDSTPDSDRFDYADFTTIECLENPNPALVHRLKGTIPPEIIDFNTEIPHTEKEWYFYWSHRYSYAEPNEAEENKRLILFIESKKKQCLLITPK